MKDHPIGYKNMVSQDRWSLVTGSYTLECRAFCPKLVVFQDRWSLMAVVSQDRFHGRMYIKGSQHILYIVYYKYALYKMPYKPTW